MSEQHEPKVCGKSCEVYSRVVGYLRPVNAWNKGKRSEYAKRRVFTHARAELIGMTDLDGDINRKIDEQFEGTVGY